MSKRSRTVVLNFFGKGRVDQTHAYPGPFLVNGATSTYSAGELDPKKMKTIRERS